MKNCALVFVFALALTASAWPSARADSFETLKGIVKTALTALEKVDELVESRRNSSEVIGRIVGKGFQYYSQSSSVMKTRNLRKEFFDVYVNLMLPRFGVPPSDQQDIKEKVFDKLQNETPPGQWVQHKMLFNPENDPENSKFIGIYGFVREDGNFDLVVLEVRASFALAKDMLIIHNKRTGEISLEEEELEMERLPGDVDKSDVQVLLKFFEATALRILNAQI